MPDRSRIEELRRRVHANPASIAFAALAEEYRRAGLLPEAIATCEAGLLRHPSYLSARVTLGRALLDAGRVDEARSAFEQVLRSAPENLGAVRGLAEIHQRNAQLPETPAPVAHGAPAPPALDASHSAIRVHAADLRELSSPSRITDTTVAPRLRALTRWLEGVDRVRRRSRAQSLQA